MINFKKAFTLAEVISVVVILGVVAMITVPTTIKRTTERQNKTRLRKAMAVYNQVMEKYFIEGSYNSYQTSIKSANKLDPNGELNGLVGEEYQARRKELLEARNQRRNAVMENYIGSVRNQFSIDETLPNNDNIFITKDGILWYLGANGLFSSVIVSPDRNFIRDLKRDARENKDVLSQLTAVANDQKDNRAFYFTYQLPTSAMTPTTNPTYGKKFDTMTVFDIKDSSSTELTYVLKMQKLYNYLNGKTNFIADKVCNTSTCCDKTQGSCIRLDKSMFGKSDYWKDVIGTETRTYKNGELQTYIAYDPNNKETVFIDYVNAKIKITKVENGVKKCYTFTGIQNKECSAVTQVYWDLYNDESYGNYGSWTDMATNCRSSQAKCDD